MGTVLAALLATMTAGSAEYVKVEVKGTLNAGVMAIGAETTGYTIAARGVTWELEFEDDALRKRADALDGKTVVVSGTLESRRGVEIRTRTIVTVKTLREAASPARR